MSLIHPQPQIKRVRRVPLEAENDRHLREYARMIQSPEPWVINRALAYFFARDREFQDWLTTHPPAANDHDPNDATASPADEVSS